MSAIASLRKTSFRSCSWLTTSRSWSSYQSPSAMAFWKIVGFDVTPVTASSSIIRFSSPVRSHSRDSESIQTDWPSSATCCNRDLAMCLLHLLDLLQPTHVPFPSVEFRPQERAHGLAGQLRADHLGAEAEHVHVVVFDALVSRIGVVADRGADAVDLAGGDRCADARPAHEDGALGDAASDRLADFAGLVWIVDSGLRLVGPEVDRLVSGAHDLLEHALPQLHAAMVEGDRDPHRAVTLPGWKAPNSGVSSASSCGSTPSA